MMEDDLGWEPPVTILLRRIARDAEVNRLRQFACDCCARIAHLLADDRSRRALATAQRHASGQASDEELLVARREASFIQRGQPHDEYAMAEPHAIAAYAVYLAACVETVEDAAQVALECATCLDDADPEWLEDTPPPPNPEMECQCELARRLFGA